MSKNNTKWLYEKCAMAKQFLNIMGYRIPIRDVPNGKKAAAFPSDEPAIYIKENSDLTNGLEEHKARAVRFGLFTREMAYQQFTAFKYLNEVTDGLEDWEVPVFKTLFTVLEDPAIETLAQTLVKGYLIKSLKYAVKRSYDVSPNIETSETPFAQCLTAMMQYGDMGPLKGHFTFPLAKKLFFNVITIMDDIMECGDPEKRVDLCLEVFELLRPLWEKEAKEKYEMAGLMALVDLFEIMLGETGKGISEGIGFGIEVEEEDIERKKDLSKGAKRTTTFKKLEELDEIERKLYEEIKDIEVLAPPESEEKDPSGSVPDDMLVIYSDEPADLSTKDDYDPEEYELEQESFDIMDTLIQAELEIENVNSSDDKERSESIPEFKEIDKKYNGRNYRCKNIYVKLSTSERLSAELAYSKIVRKNLAQINACCKKLKSLFKEDIEETEYRTSGKVDFERSMSSTVTAKVFTKSVEPKHKSDMAVVIAIDESGSMRNNSRIERATEAAINLAEIFGKLGIATYMMGFTADNGTTGAEHRHYVSWDNKLSDRIKLTTLRGRLNNFDGYTIRYASRLLNLRKEEHKILIIISDGAPACRAYENGNGYRDTKDAIREAREGKAGENGQIVLGVAIGADTLVLQKMYGTDFIALTTGTDLFGGIFNKFSSMVKKW